MVTMLEDDEDQSVSDIGDQETVVNSNDFSALKAARIRSPRLAHPEQAPFFAVEVIEEKENARL